jgi:hypothetical protein
MITVIPNHVACKNCMAILKYESSDVINRIVKHPIIEFEPDEHILLGGCWVVNGYEEVSQKYIECPICKTKIIL